MSGFKPTRFLLAFLITPALAMVARGHWAEPIAVFLGRHASFLDAADFATLYAAGRVVATGHAHLLYRPAVLAPIELPVLAQGAFPVAYLNPPFFALLFVPFSWLSFGRAYQVWSLVNLGLLGLSAWLVWKIAASATMRWRCALVLGLLTLYPVAFVLQLGQFSFILLVAWAAAYLLLRNGRERAAGLALAPLLIKPELLLPVAAFLLWKRRWAVFSTLLPASAAAVALSVAMIGPAEALRYPLFLHEIATHYAYGTQTPIMFSWNGVFGAVLGPAEPRRSLLLAIPAGLLTLALVARAWRGPFRPQGPDFPLQWLLLTLAAVLADPNLYLQDTVILAPAAIAFLCSLEGRKRALTGLVLAVGWLFASLGLFPNVLWHANLLGFYLVAGLVALLLLRRRLSTDVHRNATSAPSDLPGDPRADVKVQQVVG